MLIREIEEKHGELWRCVGRRKGRGKGYIYRFKLRDEFDESRASSPQEAEKRARATIEKIDKIFPSVEPHGLKHRFCYTFGEERKEIFEKLCYRQWRDSTGDYHEFPDEVTLLEEWDDLRIIRPSLPRMTIVKTNGKADNATFITTNCIANAILSAGNQFVHDHTAHLIQQINLMLDSEPVTPENKGETNYEATRAKWVAKVSQTYLEMQHIKQSIEKRKVARYKQESNFFLKHYPLLETSLGAFVDFSTNKNKYKDIHSLLAYKNILTLPSHSKSWLRYLQSCFPDLEVTKELLRSANDTFNTLKGAYPH